MVLVNESTVVPNDTYPRFFWCVPTTSTNQRSFSHTHVGVSVWMATLIFCQMQNICWYDSSVSTVRFSRYCWDFFWTLHIHSQGGWSAYVEPKAQVCPFFWKASLSDTKIGTLQSYELCIWYSRLTLVLVFCSLSLIFPYNTFFLSFYIGPHTSKATYNCQNPNTTTTQLNLT